MERLKVSRTSLENVPTRPRTLQVFLENIAKRPTVLVTLFKNVTRSVPEFFEEDNSPQFTHRSLESRTPLEKPGPSRRVIGPSLENVAEVPGVLDSILENIAKRSRALVVLPENVAKRPRVLKENYLDRHTGPRDPEFPCETFEEGLKVLEAPLENAPNHLGTLQASLEKIVS